MPGRTLLGMGAIGVLVNDVQQELMARGCDLKMDRIYGHDTCEAVKWFQSRYSLPASGTVDEATWAALMQRPGPSAWERCLHLTAAFEGHGFELAVGDFDGAMLTWGIVGFTLKSGEVQKIVGAVNAARPELLQRAFGERREELLSLLSQNVDCQKKWATEHTMKSGALVEPWRTMFANFGAMPEVQTEQVRQARQNYLAPAIRTARKLELRSELGLALCFDIQVQNGGICAATLATIQVQMQAGMSEPEWRRLVANTVADAAGQWKEDVRLRKLTIATGKGTVHGHLYELENWGLSENCAAGELLEQPEGTASAKGNAAVAGA